MDENHWQVERPASRPFFRGLDCDREVSEFGQGSIRWLPGYADGQGWNGCQALKMLEVLRQLGLRRVIRP